MTARAAGAAREREDDAPAAAPTHAEDERLRGMIRAELERQHALPLARRTLELLAEAEAEPLAEEPGYRVVDRSGETRLLRDRDADPDEGAGGVTAPLTLRDLVAELRERHPELFSTPPEPEVVDPVPPPPPEPAHDTLAEVRAAGARFVETQSALASSLAVSSAERGRALAEAARGRFGGWRSRFGERFGRRPTSPGTAGPADPASVPASAAAERVPEADFAGAADAPRFVPRSLPDVSGRERLTDLVRRSREALPRIDLHTVEPRRLVLVGLAVATVLAVAAAVLTMPPRQTGQSSDPQASRTGSRSGEIREPAKEAPKGAKPEAPPPEAEARPANPEPAPEDAEAAPVEDAPRNPNDLVGVPQVIDTATLKVAGKVIHLFGVEWVRGGQADELAKYIRGRTVACRPAAGSSAFLCSVEGRDLSEVVLFNGGGRASSEASPDLVAAEDHARSERLGIWKR